MVSGTYEIMMKTPMGVKKGQMIMNEDGEKLSGAFVIKGKDNPFTDGTVTGDHFSFGGELMSPVGKMVYTCEGDVTGDEVTAKAVAKKALLRSAGKENKEGEEQDHVRKSEKERQQAVLFCRRRHRNVDRSGLSSA